MKLKTTLVLVFGIAFGAALANAGILSFTCDPNINAAAAGTCNILNSTIAAQYNSTFSNVNANIYIQYGTTGLASSTTGFDNQVTYAQYAGALTAASSASGNPIQVAAVAALLNFDASVYNGGNVDITSALANALGIGGDVAGGNTGITGPGGIACSDPGSAGCYNGVITMSNAPNTWYFDNMPGTEPSTAFDFYAAAEHEVNEILGTSSCITTQTVPLSNDCGGVPSAVDLFRYSSPGSLVLDSALSTTPGAYFSYDGGATKGANGNIYNTLDNGDDYADFISSCPGGPFAVQDAEGCAGTDAGLSILNDGNAEINILNAVGYDLVSATTATPEPGTIVLLGAGLTAVALYRRRRA
jgi:hypothetical protein